MKKGEGKAKSHDFECGVKEKPSKPSLSDAKKKNETGDAAHAFAKEKPSKPPQSDAKIFENGDVANSFSKEKPSKPPLSEAKVFENGDAGNSFAKKNCQNHPCQMQIFLKMVMLQGKPSKSPVRSNKDHQWCYE
ncbi:unnamed protein product [Vicia faba]|uniref:Uncharacterized protein n=1 Tax=Vicia faba TaxID=3906 RepID=A0AAV1AIB9_VICFA|nr:unnamed protein product [Vicia faba]